MKTVSRIEIVREIYSNFASGNIPAVLERLHPKVHWRIVGPENYPFFGTFIGREGFEQFLVGLTDAAEITRFEPLEFIDGGKVVVVRGDEDARVKRNGVAYSTEWCHVFKIENEYVVSFEEYLDSATLVEAFDRT